MDNEYSYMDEWNDEEIANFKEEGKEGTLANFEENFALFNSEGREVPLADFEKEFSISKREGEEFSFSRFDLPLSSGDLVAEGDSWFDYLPGTDLIDCLRKHHGYSITNYAKAGDTLENMIYGTGINGSFQRTTPTIDKVLRKIGKIKPKVFLFSGGGNDIAGDEFSSYLNHNNSGLPVLRNNYIDNMINVVFKKYFEDLIAKVAAISSETHILIHGYGHTLPTGKGVGIFKFNFSGPWLRPALAMKGVFDTVAQKEAVERMIDSYNEMLSRIASANNKFHHIDLRNLIDQHNDWANELHLRNSAYARAADAIHQKISSCAGRIKPPT